MDVIKYGIPDYYAGLHAWYYDGYSFILTENISVPNDSQTLKKIITTSIKYLENTSESNFEFSGLFNSQNLIVHPPYKPAPMPRINKIFHYEGSYFIKGVVREFCGVCWIFPEKQIVTIYLHRKKYRD